MAAISGNGGSMATTRELGVGLVVLQPELPITGPSEQLRNLYTLSDPALSELGLHELLDALLARVRTVLEVDTVAILLLEEDGDPAHPGQLVARAAKGIEEEVEQGVRIPIGQG